MIRSVLPPAQPAELIFTKLTSHVVAPVVLPNPHLTPRTTLNVLTYCEFNESAIMRLYASAKIPMPVVGAFPAVRVPTLSAYYFGLPGAPNCPAFTPWFGTKSCLVVKLYQLRSLELSKLCFHLRVTE